jgi:hypothetical protein
MKKKKLVTSISYDFHLLGIVCRAKEYRLAWHLNESGQFDLEKRGDIVIKFKDKSSLVISNYICESDFHLHTLLRNKLVKGNGRNQLLLPELPQFDFFLKLHSQVIDFRLDEVISTIKEISVIEYLLKLDVEKIKQKENLLY